MASANARREREWSLSAWFVKHLPENLGERSGPLIESLFAEARERMAAHVTDLGGESELSAKERSLLEYEQGMWITAQLTLFAAAGKPTGDTVGEMFAKATSASRAGAGILKDLGLGRRAKPTHTLQVYLAEKGAAKAAQVDAERPSGAGPGSAPSPDGDRGDARDVESAVNDRAATRNIDGVEDQLEAVPDSVVTPKSGE